MRRRVIASGVLAVVGLVLPGCGEFKRDALAAPEPPAPSGRPQGFPKPAPGETLADLESGPPGNARYPGKTGQDQVIKLRVTSDAKGLQMNFRETLKCNRGPSKRTTARFAKQRPTIKADGTFSYSKTYELGPVPGFDEPHTQRQRITGSFSANGKTVKGRIADSAKGRSGLSCKLDMSFRATRQ